MKNLQHFVAKLCNDLLACIIKAYFGKKVTLTYSKCELGLIFKLQSIPITWILLVLFLAL